MAQPAPTSGPRPAASISASLRSVSSAPSGPTMSSPGRSAMAWAAIAGRPARVACVAASTSAASAEPA